jgi:hypothetical protein
MLLLTKAEAARWRGKRLLQGLKSNLAIELLVPFHDHFEMSMKRS